MVSILSVGYNAFDVICPVPGLPSPDSKHELAQIIFSGGGPAATAAVAMAKLGAQVHLVTPLSDDIPGSLQRAELLNAGVNLEHCPVLPGHQSPKAVILVHGHGGERTILWSRGDLPGLSAQQVDPRWLDTMNLLYLDSHEPVAGRKLALAARARNLPVVLDAGTVRPGLDRLVPLCTDVISSSIFAPSLTGRQDPAAALRALAALGPAHVAMTFGAAGCLALAKDRLLHVPAFAVTPRDTTGAGDVFHAGYAFALAQGRPWLDCLVFGSAAAALKCRDWGGRRGLPTLDEVEELVATGPRRCERPPSL